MAHETSRPISRDFVGRVWDTSEGLPQASATSMVQRKDGYLWFGTFDGLVRFDGAQFEVFDPLHHTALPSSSIVRLHLDRRQRIWIGTDRGVAIMNGERIEPFPPSPNAPTGLIESIVEDESGRIYISGTDLKIIVIRGSEVTRLPTPERSGESGHDTVTLASSAGRIYAERGRALYLLESNDAWSKLTELDEEILAIGARRGGGVWLSTASGILLAGHKDGPAEMTYPHAERRPGDYGGLYETSSGEVWSTSYVYGVVRYQRGAAPEHWSRESGFYQDSIRFVFEDDEGTLWIGTDGAGLVSARRSVFKSYSDADGLSSNLIKAVLEEGEGRWLVATHGGGVVRYEDDKFSAPLKTSKEETSPAWAWAMLRARDGAIWLGFYDAGVTRLKDGAIVRVPFPADKLTVRAFAQANDGTIYIGTSSGLYRAKEDGTGALQELALGPVRSASVLSVLRHEDEIWVATEEHGLWRIDVTAEPVPEERAPAGRPFTALAEDSRGGVFAARDDGVLFRFFGRSVQELGEAQGLPPARYRGIADGGSGTIWIASNRGVLSFHLDDLERPLTPEHPLPVRLLDEAVGLPNREVNAVTPVSNGKQLVFSTLGGLALLSPGSLPRPSIAPRVRFEELVLAGPKGTSRSSIAQGEQVQVEPGSSSILLRFTAPTSLSAERVRFDLEIDGPDSRTYHRLDRRNFQMLHPAPGHYRFRLMATNNEGLRATAPAALELYVEPHFWQRWWFVTGMALNTTLLAGLLVFLVFRSRLRRAEKHLEQEQRLRTSEERRRELLETAQALIWSLDAEGRFEMLSASVRAFYGRPAEELIGKPFAHASKNPEADRAFIEALRNEPRGADHSSVHIRADGSEVYLRFKAIARKNGEQVIGYAGTAIDVTDEQLARSEKERVEKKLQEGQRLESLGLLAGGIAHDFNNLLTTTLLNIDFLKSRPPVPGDTDSDEAIAAIEMVSQRASELCKQMLAYSGRGRFELKAIDMNALTVSTAKLVRACASKDVRFEMELGAAPATVIADAGQMGQVVMNLMLNGSEAIGLKSGTLTVRTGVREGSEEIFRDAAVAPKIARQKFLVFSTTDDGCGMTRETAARIFDPFFSTKSTGRGLGLAAVLGIVRGHAGALRVISEPEHGSTFEVWIPAAEGGTDDIARTAGVAAQIVRGDAMVVDDEAAIRSSLTRILGRRGMRVVQAENGAAALECFEPGRFEVIFLDLTMPVMGGIEALKHILDRAPDQCVVLMSGYDAKEVTAEEPGSLAFSFMSKPFRVEDIDRILEKARAHRASLMRAAACQDVAS